MASRVYFAGVKNFLHLVICNLCRFYFVAAEMRKVSLGTSLVPVRKQ